MPACRHFIFNGHHKYRGIIFEFSDYKMIL